MYLLLFSDDAIFLTGKEIFGEVFLIIICSFNNTISFERGEIMGIRRFGLVRILSLNTAEKYAVYLK